MIIREHHGHLSPPAHSCRHRSESVALLGAGPEILHLLDLGLSDDVRGIGPDDITDLLVQQLLLLLIAGQVVEKEGGCAPRGVYPRHHGVHGHYSGNVPVISRPQEHFLKDAQLTKLCLIFFLLVKLVGRIINVFSAQVVDVIRGCVNSPTRTKGFKEWRRIENLLLEVRKLHIFPDWRSGDQFEHVRAQDHVSLIDKCHSVFGGVLIKTSNFRIEKYRCD